MVENNLKNEHNKTDGKLENCNDIILNDSICNTLTLSASSENIISC